jgi:dynein heavy chain
MNKVQGIKENGVMIHKLLKEVHDAVKIDRKSPMWMAYLQYINEIVLEGVSRAIGTALKHMNEQICPINIKRNELPPLFEIRLELGDNDVVYDPIVEELPNQNISSIRNIVRGWVQDFYYIAHVITRLDRTDQSDYLQEVRDFFELREIMA